MHEVQEFVDCVTGTDAWKALEVGNEKPISVRDGRGRRTAGAESYSDFITMPKLARSRGVALHELAHIAETYRAERDDGWPYEIENGLVVPTRTTALSTRVYTSTWCATSSLKKTTTASKLPLRSAR